MTETVKGPEKKEKLTDDQVDALLNNDSFRQFLEKFDDAEDVVRNNNVETLQERHDIFEKKEKLSRDLRDLYKGDIKAEIGLDIDDKAIEDVHSYVEELALSNPEQFKSLFTSIEQLKNNTAKHDELSKDLESYEKAAHLKEQELEINKENLETAEAAEKTTKIIPEISRAFHKIIHFGDTSKHWTEPARDKARLNGFVIDNEALKKVVAETKADIKKKEIEAYDKNYVLEQAKKNIGQYQELKRSILGVGNLSEKIASKIQESFNKQFKEMLEDPNHEQTLETDKNTLKDTKLTIEGHKTTISLRKKSLPTLETGIKNKKEEKAEQQRLVLQAQQSKNLVAQREAGANIQALNTEIQRLETEQQTAKAEIEKYEKELGDMEKQVKELEKKIKETQNSREHAVKVAQNTFDIIHDDKSWKSPYLQKMSEEDSKHLGHLIQTKLYHSVLYAVENTSIGRSGLDDMDKALGKFMNMKTIGNLEGEDLKKYFKLVFDEILEKIPKNDARRLFIQRLLYKYIEKK